MINQLLESLLSGFTDDNGNIIDYIGIVSDELKDTLTKDYQEFLRQLPESFDPEDHYIGSATGPGSEQLAHDYIMTHNHEGCGFWDGDWSKDASLILKILAQAKPEIDVYLDDDGLIYAM